MSAEPFNSLGGITVGIPVISVVDSNGNIVTNLNYADGNVTANRIFANIYNYANGVSIFNSLVEWTTAPNSNTSAGSAGQAAYDSGGNLFVCVSTNTWAKFSGTTSW
jgi:hypothetical protein